MEEKEGEECMMVEAVRREGVVGGSLEEDEDEDEDDWAYESVQGHKVSKLSQ